MGWQMDHGCWNVRQNGYTLPVNDHSFNKRSIEPLNGWVSLPWSNPLVYLQPRKVVVHFASTDSNSADTWPSSSKTNTSSHWSHSTFGRDLASAALCPQDADTKQSMHMYASKFISTFSKNRSAIAIQTTAWRFESKNIDTVGMEFRQEFGDLKNVTQKPKTMTMSWLKEKPYGKQNLCCMIMKENAEPRHVS